MSEPRGDAPPDTEPLAIVTPIPLARRKQDALIWLAAAAGICLVIWGLQSQNDSFRDYWWYVWPVFLIGALGAFIARYNANKTTVTEAGKAAKRQAQAQAAHRESEFVNHWWIRYPLAVGLFAGAGWLISQKPGAGWLAAALCLYALWCARELAGILIVAGGIYLLFRGVAALPVSVAIVVGACIIASAVAKK